MGKFVASRSNRQLLFSAMRTLLGRQERLEMVIEAVMATVLTGDPSVLARSDGGPEGEEQIGELVMRGIGAEEARAADLISSVPDAETVFSQVRSAGLFPAQLSGLIDDATTEQLEQAKEDARVVLEDLAAVAMALETIFGRKVPALSLLRSAGQRRSVPLAAMLIAAFAGMRRNYEAQQVANLDVLMAATRDAAPSARAHLVSLNKPLPGLLPKPKKSAPRPRQRPGAPAQGATPPHAKRQASAIKRGPRKDQP